jgi:glycosyltransferase involved in cell wall biosynthesis
VSVLSTRSLSVVLPVHQQADHIGSILLELYAAAASLTDHLEVIAVVNGSTDGSEQICRDVGRSCPGLRVLEMPASGWGAAVRAGLAVAHGEHLCFSNSARTNSVDLRNAAALGLLNGGCAVKSVRRTRDSLRRRLGSVLYNFEARALFGLASWDINGTPKIFPRAFDRLLELREEGDLYDLEWLVTCVRMGYPIIEVPVTSVRRHGGRSTTNWSSAARMYGGAVLLRRRLGRSAAGAQP